MTSVGRVGFDKVKTRGREAAPFEIRYENGKGPESLRADAVIDATGTWLAPNPAGADGRPAMGEREVQDRLAYGMPDVLGRDRGRYAGRSVAVLGAGHSAIGTLIDLARLKDEVPATEFVWLLRSDTPEKSFGGGANDKLSARGELGAAFAALVASGKIKVETGFRVSRLDRAGQRLRVVAASACCERTVTVDELVVATGFRPELDFLREVRLSLDPALECPPALAPLIDPNEHSCGTVRPHGARELAQPEPGFYFAGMKSYGRAPDLPHADRLRAGALDRGRDRRRPRGGAQGRAGAARDRRVQRSGAAARPAGRCWHDRFIERLLCARAAEGGKGRDLLRLNAVITRRLFTIIVLGSTQTLAWASSYYLPAVLADDDVAGPRPVDQLDLRHLLASLVLTAVMGPKVGRTIDAWGGNGVLAASNLLFAAGLFLLQLATRCRCSPPPGW